MFRMSYSGGFTTSLEDLDGCKSLMVLPSDQPSSRRDVQAVNALLEDMLADPGGSAERCCSTRNGSVKAMTRGLLFRFTRGMLTQG